MILATLVDQAAKNEMGDIIRTAVAPVFLLSGIGAFVLVLTQRLVRVMDRLHAEGAYAVRDPAGRTVLQRRAKFIVTGLRLLTICATLVCGVVITLFLDYFTDLPLNSLVALLFIGAMILLSAALYCLLREVGLLNQGAPDDS